MEITKAVPVADLGAATTVSISSGPCIFVGVYVNSDTNGYSISIQDNGTEIVSIPPSESAGSYFTFPNVRFNTDMDAVMNASATGSVTFYIIPITSGTGVNF